MGLNSSQLSHALAEYFRESSPSGNLTPIVQFGDKSSLRNYFSSLEGADASRIAISEFMTLEAPPVVVPSFAERIQELMIAMGDATLDPSFHSEPKNFTVSDYYSRSAQGTEYLGKVYTNLDTGRDYKIVTWDNRTILL